MKKVTMKHLGSAFLTATAFMLLPTLGHAQMWSVQAMLDNTSSAYIRLKDKGQNQVDMIKREWIVLIRVQRGALEIVDLVALRGLCQ